jgi:hypothetical protein
VSLRRQGVKAEASGIGIGTPIPPPPHTHTATATATPGYKQVTGIGISFCYQKGVVSCMHADLVRR